MLCGGRTSKDCWLLQPQGFRALQFVGGGWSFLVTSSDPGLRGPAAVWSSPSFVALGSLPAAVSRRLSLLLQLVFAGRGLCLLFLLSHSQDLFYCYIYLCMCVDPKSRLCLKGSQNQLRQRREIKKACLGEATGMQLLFDSS